LVNEAAANTTRVGLSDCAAQLGRLKSISKSGMAGLMTFFMLAFL
jgi:hypothetical protein